MSQIITNPTLPVPSPVPNPDTAEFWAATGEGRLLIKRCTACGEAHWYPRPICPFCHSEQTRWEEASGRGTIYSYTIIRRGFGPWADAVPYAVAYVELEEGPTVMTNIVDCEVDELQIGESVELVFHAAGNGIAVPRFRPVATSPR